MFGMDFRLDSGVKAEHRHQSSRIPGTITKHVLPVHENAVLTKRTDSFKIWNTSDQRLFRGYSVDVKVVTFGKKTEIDAFMTFVGIGK